MLHELRQDRTHVGRLETYGGKLVENIVQAVDHALLVQAMTLVAQAGHKIVMHIHDEIIIDEPEDSGFTIADACQLMTTPPDWGRRTVTRRRRVRIRLLPQGLDAPERQLAPVVRCSCARKRHDGIVWVGVEQLRQPVGWRQVQLAVQVLDKGELPEHAIHSFSYRSQPDVIVQFRFDVVNAVEHPCMMSCVIT